MIIFMSVLLLSNVLPHTISYHSFQHLKTSTNIYHNNTKQRISCNTWIKRHKQYSMMYLFSTVVQVENQAIHLREKILNNGNAFLNESINLLDGISHNRQTLNNSIPLLNMISDMEELDSKLEKIYIPKLKKAEVAEEDKKLNWSHFSLEPQLHEDSYLEELKGIIYMCFELRCKLRYWIGIKRAWLKQHRPDIQLKDNPYEENNFHTKLIDMERNRHEFEDHEASRSQVIFRDYMTLHNLIEHLNRFLHKEHISKQDDHLLISSGDDMVVHKRDDRRTVGMDKGWSSSGRDSGEWPEERNRQERGSGHFNNGDISLLRRHIFRKRKNRFRNRRGYS